MSNDVCGYLVPRVRDTCIKGGLRECASALGLGISFPLRLPGLVPPEWAVLYRITDGPSKSIASYLVDMVDYSEDARMELPLNGVERLGLLTSWVEKVVRSEVALAIVVWVTDANFMDGEVLVTPESFGPRLLADSREYAPPNISYSLDLK
jgi:hypothetical protein